MQNTMNTTSYIGTKPRELLVPPSSSRKATFTRKNHHRPPQLLIALILLVATTKITTTTTTTTSTVWGSLPVAQAFSQGFQKSSSRKGPTKKKKSEYTVDNSPATQRLLEHLMDVEECEGLETVSVGLEKSTRLRGLYSKEPIPRGCYVSAIPFVSTIRLDETFFPSTTTADDDDDDDDDELAELGTADLQKLAAARIQNAVNFLHMVGVGQSTNTNTNTNDLAKVYRNCLPLSADSAHFSPTPDFWTVDQIQQLELPIVVQELLERKEQVRDRIQNNEHYETTNEFGEAILPLSPETTTEEELLHALWIVRSRAFTTLKKASTLDGTEGLLQRTVLIPFLDLLNHQNKKAANVKLEVIESKEYDESFYALVAKRAISKGEELTICYGTGEETSWEVYTKYGFWPQGHEVNDQRVFPYLAPKPQWSTTLEEDLEQRSNKLLQQLVVEENDSDDSSSAASNAERSILDFRIRMKQIQQEARGKVEEE